MGLLSRKWSTRGLIVFCSLLTACTAPSGPPSTGYAPSSSSFSLQGIRVTTIPVTPETVPYLSIKGTIPQFLGSAPGLTKVNQEVLARVFSDETSYIKEVRNHILFTPLSLLKMYPGDYEVYGQRKDLNGSANSSVVSVLMKTDASLPGGGTPAAFWISITVEVRSGKIVQLDDLFNNGTRALQAISSYVLTTLDKSNKCVVETPKQWVQPELAANSGNYSTWSLTPRGIMFAFDAGLVVSPGCGRLSITVPFSTINKFLGPTGKSIIASAR